MATIGDVLAVAFSEHRAGRVPEAAALYRRVLEADPANPNAVYLLGMAEWQSGRPVIAPTLLGRALRLNPGWIEARVNRASVLDKAGHPAEAIAEWRRLILVDPGHPQAWRHLGDAFQSHGDAGASRAIDALRRAAHLDPGLAEVHHDLGVVLRRAGQLDEAVESLVRAIAVKADLASAHMNLGNTLLERGDDAAAQASLRRALALGPASPEHWYNAGNALYAHGDSLRALRAYRRSARLGLALAHLRVATVLSDLGRLAEAEAELIESLPIPGVGVSLSIELLSNLFLRGDRLAEGRAFFTRLASTPLGGVAYRGECLTALAALDLRDGAPRVARDRLAAVRGDNGWFFTVKSLAALRATLADQGLQLVRPAAAGTDGGHRPPRVTSSSLATRGRFAHTVLEYILVRLYAETHGFVLETPDWVGGAFFELNDPPQSGPLPPLLFARRTLNELVSGATVRAPIADRDILSPLFLFEHRREYRQRVQSWLRPRRVWEPQLVPAIERLRAAGNTVVALHIRRGDFVTSNYPITETAWYVDWLRDWWPRLDRPVLYVASDDVAAIRHAFAEFHPLTRADVVEEWAGLDFLQDFHVLMNADVVGTSAASGFSALAARLNTRARLFVEPDVAARRIRPFEPWTP
ncbi:tetratricopeptide repeat protein [Azospirillum formosense]|uniref:Tetratricopeptide repeat protein n=1 Tax=Azospirillum formosense TaxID=861533 RepID=A0ABX2KW50_9PROT|nr:tetratricopeptide repeat protein [Azospirillum formosense]MBY3754362.1 tetratricopeptide repeat protein [Azospirillum formosense]NUB18782.1 tetratricopeptide repeat protein [Azospirillum formosense]